MNQVTGQLFQPNDLLPGNVVKVYNNEFVIVDMDEYSRKAAEKEQLYASFVVRDAVYDL